MSEESLAGMYQSLEGVIFHTIICYLYQELYIQIMLLKYDDMQVFIY